MAREYQGVRCTMRYTVLFRSHTSLDGVALGDRLADTARGPQAQEFDRTVAGAAPLPTDHSSVAWLSAVEVSTTAYHSL